MFKESLYYTNIILKGYPGLIKELSISPETDIAKNIDLDDFISKVKLSEDPPNMKSSISEINLNTDFFTPDTIPLVESIILSDDSTELAINAAAYNYPSNPIIIPSI